MSLPTDEKGGKSEKTPTLMTPALVMSSRPSACAAVPSAKPAPTTRATIEARSREDEVMALFLFGKLGHRGSDRSALGHSRSCETSDNWPEARQPGDRSRQVDRSWRRRSADAPKRMAASLYPRVSTPA